MGGATAEIKFGAFKDVGVAFFYKFYSPRGRFGVDSNSSLSLK